jgi:hypothetical protein
MRLTFGGSIAALTAGLRSSAKARLLPCLALAGGALLVPAVASAQSDFNWTGDGSSTNWSDSGNWLGSSAPTSGSTLGTVTFGPLSGCAEGAPCHRPSNDVADLTVDALSVGPDYSLTGDPITLGAGGITATTGAGESYPSTIMPLTLCAPQTWTMESGLEVGATVQGNEPLTADTSTGSELTFNLDAEVGPFTATGPGLVLIPPRGIAERDR